jgi:hypothetical protein
VGREWVRSEEEIHGADMEWPRSGGGAAKECQGGSQILMEDKE